MEKAESLRYVIKEMGDPFDEDSADPIILDSHEIMDSKVSESLMTMKSLGNTQFTHFMEKLKTLSRLYKPIEKNKLLLFSRKTAVPVSKAKHSMQAVKDDCNLFSQLFICQNRQCDLTEFFHYENQTCPPSLAQNGQMHQGTKSQLLPQLGKETS